jgi:16S rRNA (cytidine1402-2'-O)-methyltransferase
LTNFKTLKLILGNLYIVSTPIGNYSDLTLRAFNILKLSDYIICEDFKTTSRLIKFFNIQKELKLLNEHNEKDEIIIDEFINDLLNGKNISLVSDCGTPVWADPGKKLLERCIELKIHLDFINGSNSILAALVISGFDISRFHYIGFLSQKREIRKKELRNLKNMQKTFILLETPYRLNTIIKDIAEELPDRDLFIGMDLTTKDEMHLRGKASEILSQLSAQNKENLKGEFVIVVRK